VPFPAYLLDCTHRLVAWNSLTPKLFRLEGAANGMARLANASMLRVLFDPAYGVTQLIHNPETFFPAAIRALRYEMRRFRGERWYEAVLDDLRRCPLFEHYWLTLQSEPLQPIAARPLTPIELSARSSGPLKFRLASEVLAEDRRFRVIYYLPADSITMQTCASWSEAIHSGPC
jgi:hypothetical protein